jgi:hypothetical protein
MRTKSFAAPGMGINSMKHGKAREVHQNTHRKTKSSLAGSSSCAVTTDSGNLCMNAPNAAESPERWHQLLMMLNYKSAREWNGSGIKERNPVSRMQGRYRKDKIDTLLETQMDMAEKLELAQCANRAYLHVIYLLLESLKMFRRIWKLFAQTISMLH